MTVIDGTADSVVATVPVGHAPCAACLNPTRNVVYVANSNSNEVSVIDAAADTVVRTISTGYLPSGLVYNPDLNKLYEAATRDLLTRALNRRSFPRQSETTT